MHESEALAHNGPKPVSSDNELALQVTGFSARLDDSYTAHPTSVIFGYVCDARQLFYARTRSSRPVNHDCVENRSTHGQPILPERLKSVRRREFAVGEMSVWRAHPHAGEVRRPRPLDLLQNLHVVQNARGLWAQVLRARLVARKLRSVEEEHVDACARQ
jgi:hypothetical protein